MDLVNKDYIGAAIWSAVNIICNLYPIMSQRYNRNKATQILEGLENREAKERFIPYK